MSNKNDSDENYSVIDLPKWAKTGYSDLTDEDIRSNGKRPKRELYRMDC